MTASFRLLLLAAMAFFGAASASGGAAGSLTATPSRGRAPLTVTFAFAPPSNLAGLFRLDYGDDASQPLQRGDKAETANHVYHRAGVYTAFVTQDGLPLCAVCKPPVIATAVVTVDP
jgi:hypothetical protein